MRNEEFYIHRLIKLSQGLSKNPGRYECDKLAREFIAELEEDGISEADFDQWFDKFNADMRDRLPGWQDV